ncbi:MAG: CPXCG motif-containing cysteine-rich protein [Xanthomonadales bacterium]|jgi:hypothetical protein|nr:CPXCG motif-containing cysteine-rich protein [Xanthomonadales bacterium]
MRNPDPSNVTLDQLLRQALRLDPAAIDALYGLEPVWEPEAGAAHAALDADVEVECPHCFAPQLLRVDLTGGRVQAYVEDCQICCRPLAVQLTVDEAGALASLVVERGDG